MSAREREKKSMMNGIKYSDQTWDRLLLFILSFYFSSEKVPFHFFAHFCVWIL